MRVYLLGIVALLAVGAASAFALHQNKTSNITLYYFYEVVNGQVDTGQPLNDEPMTVEDFSAINPVSCPSGNNADCIRAWEQGHTPTTSGAGDYTIRKL